MKINTVDIEESDTAIQQCLQHPQTESLIITKDGKPYAALVPLSDLDVESVSLALNPQFLSIIEHSRKQFDEEGGISLDDMKARFT